MLIAICRIQALVLGYCFIGVLIDIHLGLEISKSDSQSKNNYPFEYFRIKIRY